MRDAVLKQTLTFANSSFSDVSPRFDEQRGERSSDEQRNDHSGEHGSVTLRAVVHRTSEASVFLAEPAGIL